MNQASHYVDLLTWLGGPLETVSAFTATLARRIEAEDSGVMALKFRSGAMGTLNVSMLTFPKNFEGSITLVGEKGLVRLGGVALNRVDAWEFSDQSTDDEAARTSSYETGSVYGFGHQAFFREVAKALRGEPNVATTGRDGLVSLATLVGAYRSAKEHRPVGFPLDM
jgi:UDP-N-acetyl-2-amino-2-deoxyglucuronate dehydrogenase